MNGLHAGERRGCMLAIVGKHSTRIALGHPNQILVACRELYAQGTQAQIFHAQSHLQSTLRAPRSADNAPTTRGYISGYPPYGGVADVLKGASKARGRTQRKKLPQRLTGVLRRIDQAYMDKLDGKNRNGTPAEQAKLLKMVLSNCRVDGASLYPTYKKPFAVIHRRNGAPCAISKRILLSFFVP